MHDSLAPSLLLSMLAAKQREQARECRVSTGDAGGDDDSEDGEAEEVGNRAHGAAAGEAHVTMPAFAVKNDVVGI